MRAFDGVFVNVLLWTFLHRGKAAERPNIILIIADDLGFTDVSFHGSKQIPTPNLDALAYDGIIMNNYYVQPICTPTRSALLTSRYPIHTGLQHSVILASQPYGLSLNESLLPQYLKELGYQNHMIGKWHLGFYAKEYTPLYRGFDTHFGYWTGAEDYWDHTTFEGTDGGLDFRDQMTVARNDFGTYSTCAFAERAQEVIKNHDKSKPLFLYLPFQSVHSANSKDPLQAPYKYYEQMSHIKDKKRRMFAAMLSTMDDAIGNVTATLHEQGLLNNSVIIFSTDNGGPAGGFNMNYASNYPLRGVKALLWEGGVRGASFVWSPLLKKSSYISNHLVHVTDWLPSILKVAGYDMSKLPARHLDGMNIWDAISTNASSSPRSEILLNIDPVTNDYAIRVGSMKLVFGKIESSKYGGWIKPSEIVETEIELPYGMKVNLLNQVPPTPIDNEDDDTPAHLFHSAAMQKIFRELGREEVTPHPAAVDCGEKPANASTNCKVSKAPCLYDISKDPCEYNNLAHEKPDVVKNLLAKINEYKKTMVKPINKRDDSKANPSRHHGVWEPWVTLNV